MHSVELLSGVEKVDPKAGDHGQSKAAEKRVYLGSRTGWDNWTELNWIMHKNRAKLFRIKDPTSLNWKLGLFKVLQLQNRRLLEFRSSSGTGDCCGPAGKGDCCRNSRLGFLQHGLRRLVARLLGLALGLELGNQGQSHCGSGQWKLWHWAAQPPRCRGEETLKAGQQGIQARSTAEQVKYVQAGYQPEPKHDPQHKCSQSLSYQVQFQQPLLGWTSPVCLCILLLNTGGLLAVGRKFYLPALAYLLGSWLTSSSNWWYSWELGLDLE